jgi:cell division protein ZapD
MDAIFEHPLNERVRNWLRLEEVSLRLRVLLGRDSRVDHTYALAALFDVLELVTRVDIKSDMLQELERQRQFWLNQDDNPMVSREALETFVSSVEKIIFALRQQIGKPGQHLREIEWLMNVKQRSNIPGALCEFDLPYFRAWLDLPADARAHDLDTWFAPLAPLQESAQWLLRLLRESGPSEKLIAEHGQFQRSVLNPRPPQLVRVTLESGQSIIPEVSANRYQIGLRFFRFRNQSRELTTEPVHFSLQQCVL